MKPIYIHLENTPGTDLPVGASHWFGYPDLPADMPIPSVREEGEEYALTLICQINLKDLPHDCHALPHAGLLLFFADVAYYRGDWDVPTITMNPSDDKVVRVVYIPEEKMHTLVSRREEYFEQDEAPAIPIILNYDAPTLEEPELQLLGTSSHLEWETWPEPCEHWQMLLQMDSMEGDNYMYNFVDWGVLCFLIQPKALKEKDFGNARAIVLST